MISDLHTLEQQFPLSGSGGYLDLKVTVTKRIATVNLGSQPSYIIRTVAKISLYNTQPFLLAPNSITSYANYPALLQLVNSLQCLAQPEAANFQLLSWTPKTVNSSVTTSASQAQSSNVTNSAQQTVGSSTAETNSFGVNVQGGFMMDAPMFTVGLNYDYAYTKSHSLENTTGGSRGRETQADTSNSFSVKDWGIYAQMNQVKNQVTWLCCQEYPWNVLQYRSTGSTGVNISPAIAARMLDGSCLLPPSQLSLFGTDFTFCAMWKFTPSETNVDVTANLLSIGAAINYVLATHVLTGTAAPYGVRVTMQQPVASSNALNLTWGQLEGLALDPLVRGRNDASINFEKLPASRYPASGPLTVSAPTNTLFCSAAGFAAGMVANIVAATASFTLSFKTAEAIGEVVLYLKHWKLDATGFVLNLTVNGTPLPALYVDSLEGEGGAANLTTITLRSTDYTSEDFNDYLVVGLNTVAVSIGLNSSGPPPSTARYCLAAAVVS